MIGIGGPGMGLGLTPAVVASGPSLPQSGFIVARWSADAITPQTDNTALATWTDSVGGIVATQGTGANQPMYRSAILGGKPGVQFTGSHYLPITTPGTMKTAIDSGIYTVVVVASNVVAQSFGCLFGSSAGSDSQFYIADGSVIGRYANDTVSMCVPWAASTSMVVLGSTSVTPYTFGSGTGLERTYVQGGCVASKTSKGPASTGAGGSFAIGAISSSGTFPCKAVVHEVLVWSTNLTPADMMRVQAWVCNKYGQSTPWSAATKTVVFDGDSLTAGVGSNGVTGAYPYKAAQTLGLAYGQWTMTAVGGMRADNMLTKASEWTAIPTITGKPLRVAADEYYNVRTDAAATIAGYASAYASTVRALPSTKLIWGTSTSHSGDPDATRVSYNGIVDASPATYGDVVVALHNDTSIGNTSAYSTNSATYWSDIVHLNAAGYTIKANLMATGITAAG